MKLYLPISLRVRIAAVIGRLCECMGIHSVLLVMPSSNDAAGISHTQLAGFYGEIIKAARPPGIAVENHMGALALMLGKIIAENFEDERVLSALHACFGCVTNGVNWHVSDVASKMNNELEALLADKGKA